MNINKTSPQSDITLSSNTFTGSKVSKIEVSRLSSASIKNLAEEKMAQSLERLPSKLDDDDDEEEEEEEGIDDDDKNGIPTEGGYDPKEFESLDAPPEILQLFSNILLYTPSNIELDYKLKPFIPEYIPTVGDIDAFIKVPRPDGLDHDGLGLLVLDEPSASKQSDPALLALRFRALTKELPIQSSDTSSISGTMASAKVKEAMGAKDIEDWIENIRKLHQETNGAYPIQSQRLPDIEHLMQEWDPEFEEVLEMTTVSLPSPELDCDLATYVTILCSLLDIPVHGSKIASLHQLFMLYNEFRSSQHFN